MKCQVVHLEKVKIGFQKFCLQKFEEIIEIMQKINYVKKIQIHVCVKVSNLRNSQSPEAI